MKLLSSVILSTFTVARRNTSSSSNFAIFYEYAMKKSRLSAAGEAGAVPEAGSPVPAQALFVSVRILFSSVQVVVSGALASVSWLKHVKPQTYKV